MYNINFQRLAFEIESIQFISITRSIYKNKTYQLHDPFTRMEDKKWNEFSVTRIASIDKNRETAYAMIDRWERERERKNGKGEERRGERSADIHRGFLDRRVLSFPGDRPTIAQQRFSPRLFAHRMDGRVFTVDKIATHRATALRRSLLRPRIPIGSSPVGRATGF